MSHEPIPISAVRIARSVRARFVVEELTRTRQPATLRIERRDGRHDSIPLLVRIDTPIEAAYFRAGGIMPYVLEQLLAYKPDAAGTM